MEEKKRKKFAITVSNLEDRKWMGIWYALTDSNSVKLVERCKSH